jgi:hypothetical protein
MAHPDKTRQGSEKGQREHAGRTSARSDAGLQTKSQGARGEGPVESDGAVAHEADASLNAPDAPSDAFGPVVGRGMDRAAGDDGSAPTGEARETEGREAMSDRGLPRTGEARTEDAQPRPGPDERRGQGR